MNVEYTSAARAALRAIYDTSLERHGFAQAERYYMALVERIQAVAADPNLSRNLVGFPEVRKIEFYWPGARSGHVVLLQFDIVPNTMTVLVIYHSRMDIERRLRRDLPFSHSENEPPEPGFSSG